MTRQDFTSTNFLVETLMRTEGLGRKAVWRLAERFRTWENFLQKGTEDRLRSLNYLPEDLIRTLLGVRRQRRMPAPSPHFFSYLDPRYPQRLHALYDPPCGLYFRGDREIFQKPGIWVAVVGTRRASGYALETCVQLVEQMKEFQPVIVSGLALGIDGMAHRAALARGLDTVAVLGSSVETIYPFQHRELARHILKQGLLLSENPAGTAVARWHFPQRNRIIAALADVVVLVEAPEKSGALLTADFALDLGKAVYVVPGPVTSDLNRGGHRLIQQGAQLLMDGREIFVDLGLAELRPSAPKPPEKSPDPDPLFSGFVLPPLGETERKLLEIIGFEACHIDKITDMSHLPSPQVTGLLVQLSLKGLVEELPGQRFALKALCRELLSKPES